MKMKTCFTHSDKYRQFALLALRVAVGVVFVYHGWLKIEDIDSTVAFFDMLGIPLTVAAAWLVAIVEFVGGAALILGVYAQTVSYVLVIDMLAALLLAHTRMPYVSAELPIALLGGLIVIGAFGAGSYRLMKTECICGAEGAKQMKK